jgi:small subunit ribosomal protein S1
MGQTVECVVLDIDIQAKRISLGLKQLEPDPWTVFTQKYNPGDIIHGKVRSITDYGVFVGIEDGVDGMVHKSDLSWTQRINNPADVYRKGDEVEAIILSVNHDERKVSLGIKQLYEDPWNFIPERYPEGTVLEVRGVAVTEFGVHVELERGVEGTIPRAEISHDLSVEPSDIVKIGDILKEQIVRLDHDERRITLSLRDSSTDVDDKMKYTADENDKPQRRAIPSSRPSATLGDVLKDKLGDLATSDRKTE